VQNNWLFYATGGLALTSLHGDFTFTDGNTALDAAIIQQSARANTLSTGYAVGAGVEVGLTDRLSAKAEYLHVSFPDAVASQTFATLPILGFNQSFRQSIDLHADFLRFGLNYRFGGPDLVPAMLPFCLSRRDLSKRPLRIGRWRSERAPGSVPARTAPRNR